MKIASLTYAAIREMERLLRIKGQNGGRNYDLPDGRNCHLAISPPFLPHMCGKAIIGRDRVTQCGSFRGPILDIEYALQEVQRFRHQLVDTLAPEPDGGSPGTRLSDFFHSRRLSFASEGSWEGIEWSELSRAIRHFDAVAMFFVDRSIIEFVGAEVRQSLIARGFAWLPVSRDSTVASVSSCFSMDEQRALDRIHVIDLHEDAPWEDGYGSISRYCHCEDSSRKSYVDEWNRTTAANVPTLKSLLSRSSTAEFGAGDWRSRKSGLRPILMLLLGTSCSSSGQSKAFSTAWTSYSLRGTPSF